MWGTEEGFNAGHNPNFFRMKAPASSLYSAFFKFALMFFNSAKISGKCYLKLWFEDLIYLVDESSFKETVKESRRNFISIRSIGLLFLLVSYLVNLCSFCSSIDSYLLILVSDYLISSLILDGLAIFRGDPILSVPN